MEDQSVALSGQHHILPIQAMNSALWHWVQVEPEIQSKPVEALLGGYDKRVISKLTLPTIPELFIGLIQAIWQKN